MVRLSLNEADSIDEKTDTNASLKYLSLNQNQFLYISSMMKIIKENGEDQPYLKFLNSCKCFVVSLK